MPLEKEEFRILNAIELSMRKFEWVPFKNIVFYARYDPEEVQFWLDKVHKKDLIIRKTGKEQRYVLNSKGYDLLALHALAEKDIVVSIGNSLGMGKESDVYQGLDANGERVALKFHRIGRTSFRDIKRKRDYARGKGHTSWLYMCRLSARKEADYLEQLKEYDLNVPILLGYNRHVIVLELYEGQELHEFPDLEDPEGLFAEIKESVRTLYRDAGIVHADLGEFNLIYTIDKELLIIDWPQAVSVDHPNAKDFLYRDIENICHFFQKHGVQSDIMGIFNEIVG